MLLLICTCVHITTGFKGDSPIFVADHRSATMLCMVPVPEIGTVPKYGSFRQREKMIASDIVMEIRQMLAQGGISQRAIAQRMGVSRGTVWAIAQGKRHDRPRIIQGDSQFVAPAGRAVRCSGCGGLVQMPCLACYIRSYSSRSA